MSIYFIIGNTFDTPRAVIGPLNPTVCRIGVLTKNWMFYNVCFFTLLITLTKFTYICIFKSLPAMDDKFIALIVSLIVNLVTSMIIYVWMTLPGKEPLSVVSCIKQCMVIVQKFNLQSYLQLLCTGTYYEEWLTESKKVPTVVYTLLGCVLIGSAAAIAVWISKCLGKHQTVHSLPEQFQQPVDLGSSLSRSWLGFILFTMGIWTISKYER